MSNNKVLVSWPIEKRKREVLHKERNTQKMAKLSPLELIEPF